MPLPFFNTPLSMNQKKQFSMLSLEIEALQAQADSQDTPFTAWTKLDMISEKINALSCLEMKNHFIEKIQDIHVALKIYHSSDQLDQSDSGSGEHFHAAAGLRY